MRRRLAGPDRLIHYDADDEIEAAKHVDVSWRTALCEMQPDGTSLADIKFSPRALQRRAPGTVVTCLACTRHPCLR